MNPTASLRTAGPDTSGADRPRLPVVRLRIRCGNAEEYRRVRAPEFVARGVQVRGERDRAVGERVRLKIELLDGTLAYDGEAEVAGHVGGAPRPRMVLKLVEPRPSPRPQARPAATARPAAALPRPAAALPRPAPTAPSRPAAPPASPRLAELLFSDLDLPDASADGTGPLDLDEELLTPRPARLAARGPVHAPPPLPARAASEAPPGDVEPTPVPQELARAAPPVPACVATPEDDGGPDLADPDDRPTSPTLRQRLAALPRPRHAVPIAAAVAVAVIVGIGTLAIAAGPTRAEARAADFVAELRRADERMRAGRLAGAGNDSALDHLVAARALVPDDPRLARRVKVLSELFGDLGERALARGDVEEAAAHFQAWLRADPASEPARRRLREIADRPRAPVPDAWPGTGASPGGSPPVKAPR